MKNKNILILFITLVLLSCDGIGDPGGEPIFDGFMISVNNSTNKVYQGEIVIGGLQNNNFIATDSVSFKRDLEIGGSNLGFHFVNDNRWKPNLDKIKTLPSDSCYFKLKLSSGRQEIITRYNSNKLFSLKLPETTNFKGDFGRLIISISDTSVIGRAAKED
ncbi:MAG: hypothetical protein AB8B78_12090 [Polaribacter sp.]